MKKIVLFIVMLILPLAGQAQQNRVSDKELVSVLWASDWPASRLVR